MLTADEIAWLTAQGVTQITSLHPFTHALSNDVFLVVAKEQPDTIFKRLNTQARSAQDRENECLLQAQARLAGLTPAVIASSAYYKLQEYVRGERLDSERPDLFSCLATQLQRIHQLPLLHAPQQRLAEELLRLKNQLNHHVDAVIFNNMLTLAQQLDKSSARDTLCHGDLSLNNIIVTDAQQFFILDWEYSVIACAAYDLAFCCAINQLSNTQQKRLISLYYQQITDAPSYTLDSLQKECQLYLRLFNYINELWSICFVEKV